MKVALAGAGAFGVKQQEAIAKIDGVEVVSLVGRTLEATQEVARRFGVGHVTTELAQSLARRDVDAVILCTPTQIHASQAIECLRAGKHVQVEIPLADKLSDAERWCVCNRRRAELAMVGHTRRFNRPPVGAQAVRRADRDSPDGLQTYFFRRKNINALGQPRSWTDHLLWHHAAHTVDLSRIRRAAGSLRRTRSGADSCRARIAMDMSISSNHGRHLHAVAVVQQRRPLGTFSATSAITAPTSRATTTSSTARARSTCRRLQPDEQHRAAGPQYFAAIARDAGECQCRPVLACYRTLDRLERQLAGQPA
jgi:2-hydroxy-4-carboxymuconate semialdehyde hemiacetal dehydrogenase